MKKRREKHSSREELWIGLARVSQSGGGVLGDADQAYTNAIAIADSKVAFRKKVKEALTELELTLMRLENAETLHARLSKYTIDRELTLVAEEVSKTRQVGFGTFHPFDAE